MSKYEMLKNSKEIITIYRTKKNVDEKGGTNENRERMKFIF